MLGNIGNKVLHNTSIQLEQVISSDPWTSRNTGWDNHHGSTFQRLAYVIRTVPNTISIGVDMRKISSNTLSELDIIESQLRYHCVQLQQQRQWLPDTTRCAQNCNFYHFPTYFCINIIVPSAQYKHNRFRARNSPPIAQSEPTCPLYRSLKFAPSASLSMQMALLLAHSTEKPAHPSSIESAIAHFPLKTDSSQLPPPHPG